MIALTYRKTKQVLVKIFNLKMALPATYSGSAVVVNYRLLHSFVYFIEITFPIMSGLFGFQHLISPF